MNLTSHQTKFLNGEVICPGDKSISQRIVILGSLLNCDMKVKGFLNANDPNSTLNALNKIGAGIEKQDDKVFLHNRKNSFKNSLEDLNLGNSGTGMRLMMGLISGLQIKAKLIGDSSLSNRPMLRVIKPLKEMGALIKSNKGKAPIEILESSISNDFVYKMPIASAQVKSSLMLASLASHNSITIYEPKITRNHTERMIEYFGGKLEYYKNKNGFIKLNKSNLKPKKSYDVVGDFSSASFIIVATLIAKQSEVLIKNVGLNPTRNGLIKVLSMMDANIEIKNQKLICNEESGDILVKSSNLKGIEVPEEIIPNIIDEIPILSIAAAFAEGLTSIKNASELRVKESDRLNAISDGLDKLKIKHDMFNDGILIEGNDDLVDFDGYIDSFDDHRIAMSFLIAGIRSKNGISVKNCQNIETSFPGFKATMTKLGMKINEKN